MKLTKFIAALCGVVAFVCSCEKEDSKTNDDFMRFKSILSAFALMVPVCMVAIFTSCEKKDVTVAVTGIEVTPAFVELKPGETQELKVSVLPENATDKTYTWSSSDESVATVADDVVTAVADGSAVITAVAADGTHKASVTVKVTTPATPPYDGIVASSAGAVFIGDKYDMGYNDEISVYLLSGDVKYSDSSLSGKGSALWLDLYLPVTGKAVLPAHHYKAMLDEEMTYVFQTGMDLRPYGGITGSYIYENNEYVMVEDGTVDITLDGSTYTVDAVVKSFGKEYKFRYTGAIEVKTSTGGGNVGGTTVDGGGTTVNVGKLTQARFEYYGGDAYGTNGVSDNWILYLYDDGVSIGNDGFTGAGDIMMIELNCPVGVKDHIEPGTYPVIHPTEITGASVLKPFTTVPGLENSKGHIYGTWYLSSKYSEDESFSGYYGASEGSVTVDKTDDGVYSISFEIKDTDIQGIVSGSFEGKASIFDGSSSASVSMSSASMKSSLKSARRIAFRK